jgi:hypothetical protein
MSAQQQVRYRGFPATDRDRLQRFIDRFDGALQGRLDGEDRIALAVLHLTNHCPHGRLLALGWLGRN